MKLAFLGILASLLLVACSTGAGGVTEPPRQSVRIGEGRGAQETSTNNPEQGPELSQAAAAADSAETISQKKWPDGEARSDRQGSVEVAISPINLNGSATSLYFDVSLNTHSVDLSMDLASLATLDSDNGVSVKASLWDAPRGGHHVAGILSFPAEGEGAALLENASRLTLTLRDVDVPERIFTWDASQ